MKKKHVIIMIFLIVISLWIYAIYKLSAMNTSNSNGKSTDIISVFIEDSLEITNNMGVTNSHPSDAKIAKASNLLNAPLRKCMHALVYFVLAIIIILFITCISKKRKYIIPAIITIICIIIAASLDEYHQTFVDGRTGQIKDVLIDTAGGVCGILFYGTYYLAYHIGYKKGKEDKYRDRRR